MTVAHADGSAARLSRLFGGQLGGEKGRDRPRSRLAVDNRDGVAVLNTKGSADAFVIVRAVGVQDTNGKAFMKGGLLGMMTSRGKTQYRSKVALVDAKSGDILFLGDYFSWGSPGTKLLESSFKQLPLAE